MFSNYFFKHSLMKRQKLFPYFSREKNSLGYINNKAIQRKLNFRYIVCTF